MLHLLFAVAVAPAVAIAVAAAVASAATGPTSAAAAAAFAAGAADVPFAAAVVAASGDRTQHDVHNKNPVLRNAQNEACSTISIISTYVFEMAARPPQPGHGAMGPEGGAS